MRFFAVIISIIPVIYLIYRLIRREDLLHPLTFFTAFYVLRIVIPIVMYSNEELSLGILQGNSNLYLRTSILNNDVFVEYAVLQSLCFFITLFGITSSLGSRRSIRIKISNHKMSFTQKGNDINNYKHLGFALLIIGFISFAIMMRSIGGLTYFLANLQLRTYIIGNLDLLYWLVSLLGNAPILLAYYYFKKYPDNKAKQAMVIILCVLAVLMSGLGVRSSLVSLLIQLIIIYHYTVRNIKFEKLLSPRYILIAVGLIAFIVVMPALRSPGEWDSFISTPGAYLREHFNGVFQLITRESYVPHYTAVIQYFKTHSFWWGASFKGLLTGFIPSSLYPGKPPVDDGMYLYSICLGRGDIFPTMPTSSLNLSSYPLETFGSMYANFGVVGIVIGFFILGRIIGRSYIHLKSTDDNRLFNIIIYTTVVTTFQLSTLRIEQFIISYVKWMIIFWIISSFHLRSREEIAE